MLNLTNNLTSDASCEMNAFERRLFVPNEGYRTFAYAVCLLICLLGITGNILAFLGLCKVKKSSTTFLLKTLTITDTVFLLVRFNLTITYYIRLSEWRWNTTFGCIYSTFVMLYIWIPMIYFAHAVSVWIVVLIGVNRCIIVCYPTLTKRFSRIAIYKVVLCIILCCAFALSS